MADGFHTTQGCSCTSITRQNRAEQTNERMKHDAFPASSTQRRKRTCPHLHLHNQTHVTIYLILIEKLAAWFHRRLRLLLVSLFRIFNFSLYSRIPARNVTQYYYLSFSPIIRTSTFFFKFLSKYASLPVAFYVIFKLSRFHA